MGHDIYAYTVAEVAANAATWAAASAACDAGDKDAYSGVSELLRPERAYLRRNMGSDTIHTLYDLLGCTDLDGGVSGIGEGRAIPLATIRLTRDALEASRDRDDFDREIEFLSAILADKEIKADGEVHIRFA